MSISEDDEEQMRQWARRMLERLDTSKFRASFSLTNKDRLYALEKVEDVIRRHARDLLSKRAGASYPEHDGKQTPYRGHPVFTAQHATATCCRGCIEKWHHIPKGRPLTEAELDALTELVVRWIRRDIVRAERRMGAKAKKASEKPAKPAAAQPTTTEPRVMQKPDLDQHFLVNTEKIGQMLEAAGIQAEDSVVELGAGIGSVAAHVPHCRSLTLVELDPQLCARLHARFAKRANVRALEQNALAYLADDSHVHDVIISNLPHELTELVARALTHAAFRTVMMAVREGQDIRNLLPGLTVSHICTLDPEDFSPHQPFRSDVLRIAR